MIYNKSKQSSYLSENMGANQVESVWAVLKRGVYGVYHQVSKSTLPGTSMNLRFA